MPHDAFISYRHEDEESAKRICQGLEARNISCWVACRDIRRGREWPAEIMDALEHSKYFVLVLSSHSVNEEQISREVRVADERKLPIFPVRIENVQLPKTISYFLGGVQWVDAFNGKIDSAVEQLAASIRETGDASADARPIVTSTPVQKTRRTKPFLWLGIAAVALIAIAVIAFFATRAPGPKTVPQAGIDAATRFLNDLNAGNIDGAWNELTPTRQGEEKRDRWIKSHRTTRQTNGPFTYKRNGCPAAAGNQGYTCDYTLKYNNGKSGAANITVTQEANGNWGVDFSSIRISQ